MLVRDAQGTGAAPVRAGREGSAMLVSANDIGERGIAWLAGRRGIGALKAARVVCDDGEHLCLIRNVSPRGMIIDVNRPMVAGRHLLIKLAEDVALRGTVAWVRASRVAMRFCDGAEVPALLGRIAGPASGAGARTPRLEVNAWARLRVGPRVFSTRVRDIAQGGAKVRVQGLNTCNQDAVLTPERFRAVQGVVRWSRGDEAGISFNEPLGFAELMLWLGQVRHSPDESVTAGPSDREGLACPD